MAPRNKAAITSTDESSDDWSKQSFDDESSDHKQRVKGGRSGNLPKGSDEYRKRRERNNIAVKKSRNKTKLKTQQTLERVNQLRAENEMLEAKIKLLSKELSFLKDLFLAHAGSAHGQTLTDVDLSFLNENGSKIAEKPANNDAIENDHKYTSPDCGISG